MKLKESETLELKKSTSELKEAVISITAILNKHGKGELYFGIKNDGAVVGQQISDKTIRDISRSISESIEPKIYPTIKELEIDGKHCIHISFHGESAPYLAYGRAYLRVGDEDRQMSAKELEGSFIRKNRAAFSWDDKICDKAKLSDISEEKVRLFLEKAGLKFDSKISALKNLGLIQDGQLLNAAVMLFAEKPQDFFPNAKMRGAVFLKGGKSLDMKDYEGDLLYLIDEAQNYVLRNTLTGERIEGLTRVEVPEINEDALREAVINAFCHRDYNLYGSVDIAVYPDRVEIRSPGKLYGDLTIKKITTQQISERRNRIIADLFHRIHLVEKWGRGIEKILRFEPKTTFKEIGGQFYTVFERHSQGAYQGIPQNAPGGTPLVTPQATPLVTPQAELTSRESSVYNEIKKNPKISRKSLSDKLSISQDTIKEYLEKLKAKGVIRRVGRTSSGHWEIIKDNNNKG